jgi:hypothetical protein
MITKPLYPTPETAALITNNEAARVSAGVIKQERAMTIYKGKSMADGIETVEHLRKSIDGLSGDTPISPTMKITLFESVESGDGHIEISEDDAFDEDDL